MRGALYGAGQTVQNRVSSVGQGQSHGPELAEKFEVSVRTIYRDLDAISAAGIPIYTVQGKGGGIFILPEFVLEKSLLTPQEKEQILMALQGLAAAEDSRTDELLTKLGGLFRVQGANWIEVDFSDWHKNTAGAELFDELKGLFSAAAGSAFRILRAKAAALSARWNRSS